MAANRRMWALALAAALPLAGFIGLRPALAENTPPCGAVTGKPCESGGLLFGGIYQVKITLDTGAVESQQALCKGGPSPESRDTALGDNLFELLIAQAASGGGIAEIERVVDSKNRLVGYTTKVNVPVSPPTKLDLFVTCINDH